MTLRHLRVSQPSDADSWGSSEATYESFPNRDDSALTPRSARTAAIPTNQQNLHLWRKTTLLSLALISASLLGAVGAPSGTEAGRVVIAHAWLTSHLVLLAGGCLLHARWRMTHEPAMAWLATGFLVPSFQLVPLAMVRAIDPPPPWTDGVGAPLDLAATLVMLALVAFGVRKRPFPAALNPIGLAATLALPCAALALAASTAAPPPPAAVHTLAVLVVVLGGVAVFRLRWLSATHQVSLVVAVAGLTIAHDYHNVTDQTPTVPAVGQFVVAAISVVSAVGIVVLTLGLFRRALDRKAHRLAQLRARAEAAEESLRHDEELMHEVRATMAGISTAAQVLQGNRYVASPVTEQQLHEMLAVEVSRIQRLLSGREGAGPSRIDLDELLQPQVVAQRALGHDVRWDASGIAAHARRDNVTEAVHVLLTNATRYAAGAPVYVRTALWRGLVSIAVTDSGPGVPPDMRPVLFERGARETGSPGLGVGLYLAKNAVQADGGSLWLSDAQPGCGATFVISLPAAACGDHS